VEGDRDRGVYEDLRSVALGASPRLPRPPWEHPDVWGLVADIPMHGGFATVVALTDGTASMYTSSGGALLGAGDLPGVADAVRGVLFAAQDELEAFGGSDDGSLPPAGTVRLHLLVPAGGRVIDLAESDFWGREPHRLRPVTDAIMVLVELLGSVPT
jgi:hypothetical protein